MSRSRAPLQAFVTSALSLGRGGGVRASGPRPGSLWPCSCRCMGLNAKVLRLSIVREVPTGWVANAQRVYSMSKVYRLGMNRSLRSDRCQPFRFSSSRLETSKRRRRNPCVSGHQHLKRPIRKRSRCYIRSQASSAPLHPSQLAIYDHPRAVLVLVASCALNSKSSMACRCLPAANASSLDT